MNLIETAQDWKIGQEVAMEVKGVTNERVYKVAGEIVSIHGNYAQVRYPQPWSRKMRVGVVDLRTCRRIKRRRPRT
jgi:Tfp pilus assembly protein PilZ